MRLEGKTALITGGSRGIGAAIAKKFVEEGAKIVVSDILKDELEKTVAELNALKSGAAAASVSDVTNFEDVQRSVAETVKFGGKIDILVNNAGYGSYGAIEDVPLAEARRQMEVNLFGAARLIQLALPQMRAQAAGRIVNVSSIGGRFAMTPGGWYHATKYALEALSDAVRQEVRPFGIAVVVVEPGAIRTEWGAIAAQHLRATSGNGPYAELAGRFIKALGMEEAHPSIGSDPDLVGRLIARAATTPHPRPRYAVGAGAKPAVYLSRLLPAQAVDGLVRLALRLGRTTVD